MIYPTARAVLLLLAGAPVALAIGLWRADLWVVALGWILFVVLLAMVDALADARPGDVALTLSAPGRVMVGEPFAIGVTARDARGRTLGRRSEYALALDARFDAAGRLGGPLTPGPADQPDQPSMFHGQRLLSAARRGSAPISDLWVRWTGPLGLMWKQRREAVDRTISVVPNLRSVREDGVRLFTRDAQFGLRSQLLLGEGSEYEALAEYRPGMDRRAIDWKQSARHVKLLAKEYRIERDNRLVLAIDTGRTMSEPVAGMPRVDRAVSAALLLGYVGLKMNDRVSLFSFAARPQTMTPAYSHSRDFSELQNAAARIDYGHEESNFTLALTSLSATLKRRSLIILFTEFTDPTSADLMIRAAGRLVAKHKVLFVVLKDAELDAIIRTDPVEPADVIRANVASALARDRRLVIARLQRMGVEVIEAAHDAVGARVIAAYLSAKRQGGL